MAFKVSTFKSNVFNDVRPFHNSDFEVSISSPFSKSGSNNLNFKIESVDLPGRVIEVVDNRFYGPARQVAKNVNYQPISMTVLCSSDFNEQQFFLEWMDAIVGDHRVNNAAGLGPSSITGYEVGYYDDYAKKTDTTISVYNRGDTNPTRIVKLIQSFPISLTPLALSWSNNDIARFNVQMQFRHWKDENKITGSRTSQNSTSSTDLSRNLAERNDPEFRRATNNVGIV